MNRFRNIFMLVVWIGVLVYGAISICYKIEINPAIFICAVLVCIMHYVGELMEN